MILDKVLQALRGRFAFGKIEFAQRFHDPDIHRERLGMMVGEQQHAIRNLGADSVELGQLEARFIQRQFVE